MALAEVSGRDTHIVRADGLRFPRYTTSVFPSSMLTRAPVSGVGYCTVCVGL